jgi:hypothetical protein
MQMFIANGMHQNIDFQYRLPQYKSYRTQLIPVGGQIRISGELTSDEIDRIALHHAIYGMVSARDFKNYRGFHIPYIYSVNEPISADLIAELVEQNRIYNVELGKQLRQEAAVAVSATIEDNLPPQTTERLKNLDMTIEEVPSKDRDATIDEGIRITRDIEKGAPQGPLDFALARKARKLF